MLRFAFAFCLVTVLFGVAKAQNSAFIGDWDVTLVQSKNKVAPWMEIAYPTRMTSREENGKLVGSYTDHDFSDQFSFVAVIRNELLFVHGGAGKKYQTNLMPVHRAIVDKGVLRGYVFTSEKQFEWIARKRS